MIYYTGVISLNQTFIHFFVDLCICLSILFPLIAVSSYREIEFHPLFICKRAPPLNMKNGSKQLYFPFSVLHRNKIPPDPFSVLIEVSGYNTYLFPFLNFSRRWKNYSIFLSLDANAKIPKHSLKHLTELHPKYPFPV